MSKLTKAEAIGHAISVIGTEAITEHPKQTALRDLSVGEKFRLLQDPPHGSITLQKIEPEPIMHPNIRKEFEGILFYNAVWVDGPHSGTKACLPEGEKKNTYMVIKVI